MDSEGDPPPRKVEVSSPDVWAASVVFPREHGDPHSKKLSKLNCLDKVSSFVCLWQPLEKLGYSSWGEQRRRMHLAGSELDLFVLPAKYLYPRSGVSLGDLAPLGESEDARRCQTEGNGRSKDAA